MDKTKLVSFALVLASLGVPAFSTELRPAPASEDVVIQNTVSNAPIAKTKEDMRHEMQERDKKLDAEYKQLKDKPSMIRHPIKRADVWIDYHQDTYRKFHTRVLPATQFAGVMIGTGFSIAGAL